MSSRIDSEKHDIRCIIGLYCRHRLGQREMPDEYRALADYAESRLDRCRFGEDKTSCKRCPIHCYRPDMRERMRQLMRWIGPRMIFYAPGLTLRHILGRHIVRR